MSPNQTVFAWGATKTAALSSTLAVTSTAAFDAQTRAIRVVGTSPFCLNWSSASAATSNAMVPANTPQILTVGGQFLAVVSISTSTGTLWVTELS